MSNKPAAFVDAYGLFDFPPLTFIPPPYPGDPTSAVPINCFATLMKWAKLAATPPGGIDDKWLHCLAGCEIAHACPRVTAIAAALYKELRDKITGKGTYDPWDAIATVDGGSCDRAVSCHCCCRNKGYTP